MLKDLYSFKKKIEDSGIIFCYSGPVSQSVAEEIANAVKERIDMMEESQNLGDKVFTTFVEQVQNIMRYSAEKQLDIDNREVKIGLTLIGKEENKIFRITSNLITKDQVEGNGSKLEKIKGKDKDQLQAYFKQKMKEEPDPSSKGAGLGFIDMARKSNGLIDYNIERIDDQTSFFSMQVKI